MVLLPQRTLRRVMHPRTRRRLSGVASERFRRRSRNSGRSWGVRIIVRHTVSTGYFASARIRASFTTNISSNISHLQELFHRSAGVFQQLLSVGAIVARRIRIIKLHLLLYSVVCPRTANIKSGLQRKNEDQSS
ncbi:hypothetical protein BDV98DRAFT_293627 [Pterulicium gracile]|uniref:Uncharacterized protein n=1 Tax=Pterulicium gracile TaxID=1884261 RepID=A0A5C3QTX0_9AGAR|nr:hypothetical protein BDV98DRAFT_293627 [Pterula gracilis]